MDGAFPLILGPEKATQSPELLEPETIILLSCQHAPTNPTISKFRNPMIKTSHQKGTLFDEKRYHFCE